MLTHDAPLFRQQPLFFFSRAPFLRFYSTMLVFPVNCLLYFNLMTNGEVLFFLIAAFIISASARLFSAGRNCEKEEPPYDFDHTAHGMEQLEHLRFGNL